MSDENVSCVVPSFEYAYGLECSNYSSQLDMQNDTCRERTHKNVALKFNGATYEGIKNSKS